MKISGFTIIKNAVINDYPIVEAISSVLDMVDEMVVLIGDSKDETKELILSIGSDKIKIYDSVWDKTLRRGGEVLAVETNKAFQLIDPQSTWAFYIQADEIVHERYRDAILNACQLHKDDGRVDGLLFKYLHFYGTYDYIGDSRKWYNREVRIIKNDKRISAYKDAQGFRKGKNKLKVKPIKAYIYHYGWVKNPVQMKRKILEVRQYWHEDSNGYQPEQHTNDIFDFRDFDSLQKFKGSHPQVMKQRVANQHWHIDLDISRRKFTFKNRILYWIEKKTGFRLFNFKNYKII